MPPDTQRGNVAIQLNNSVARAFAILNLFSETRRTITAADLVRELDLNAITAHRFLKTLEGEGALVLASKGHYRLGYMLVDLGRRAEREDDLGQLLQPELDALSASTQEASMATLYQSGMVVCIARGLAQRSLSVDVRVGSRLEAYCTAHGKLWLAFMSGAERTRYLDSVTREARTGTTITDRDALVREIETVATQGYAVNRGEREDGITAIAVPVFGRDGKMVTGLSIFGPTFRISDNTIIASLTALRQAAERAADRLYGSPT